MALPQATDRPSISVEEAAQAYGLSRAGAYRACHTYLGSDGQSGIPCIRIGGRIVIPTAAVRKHLGLDQAEVV